jgi:single-strand DNA-binding protein
MLNRHELIGRVGKDVEVRNLDNGNMVANFSIATTEKWKDKSGEKKEETSWHNIVIWGKLAEIAQKYVKKGDLIYVSGKSKTRSWEKDGITRYTTEVYVDDLKMLGSKSSGGQQQSTPEPSGRTWQSETPPHVNTGASDDLPF